MNKRTNTKSRKLLNAIVIVLMILSALFLLQKPIARLLTNRNQPTITKEIIDSNKGKATIGEVKEDGLSASMMIMNQLKGKHSNIIGVVSIPEIGIKQPIINELNDYAISVGSSVIFEENQMGKDNYVLTSHFSYVGESFLFSPLYYQIGQGVNGQKMYLTDLSDVYEYKVSEYKVVDESDTKYIQQDYLEKPLLTLYTCNYYSEWGRIILQGELVKKTPIKEMTTEKINELFQFN